jgi:hypothetical protein
VSPRVLQECITDLRRTRIRRWRMRRKGRRKRNQKRKGKDNTGKTEKEDVKATTKYLKLLCNRHICIMEETITPDACICIHMDL